MIGRSFLYGFFVAGSLSLPAAAFAQCEQLVNHFRLNAGPGLTTITGANAGTLDHGGNLQLHSADGQCSGAMIGL